VVAAGSILDPLYTALGWVMALLYSVIPSYGIAIILLTVVVRLVLYPLTVKQTKSMQAMQRLQPEIKRLQAKYKNDRQKLNEEMMAFYKENKVNPLSGCLPLVLQLPLFIVLYRLIHDLTTTVITGAIIVGAATSGGAAAQPVTMAPTGGGSTQVVTFQNVKISDGEITNKDVKQPDGSTATSQPVLNDSVTAVVLGPDGKPVGELQGKVVDSKVVKSKTDSKAPVVDPKDDKHVVGTIEGAVIEVGPDGAQKVATPKHIPKDSDLYKDLVKDKGHMPWLGMDLSKRASQGQGAEVIGLYLLVALTVVTGYYQQRQMTARTPASAQNPQMQMMGKIFPLFFGFISLQIPAGVVLYFVVSNLWQIGQQAIIFRQQDREEAAKVGGKGGSSGGAKPTPKLPPAASKGASGGSDGGNPSGGSGGGNSGGSSSANRPGGSGGSGGGSSNRNRRRKRRRRGR